MDRAPRAWIAVASSLPRSPARSGRTARREEPKSARLLILPRSSRGREGAIRRRRGVLSRWRSATGSLIDGIPFRKWRQTACGGWRARHCRGSLTHEPPLSRRSRPSPRRGLASFQRSPACTGGTTTVGVRLWSTVAVRRGTLKLATGVFTGLGWPTERWALCVSEVVEAAAL